VTGITQPYVIHMISLKSLLHYVFLCTQFEVLKSK
jgi:hypothetical protein